MDCNINRNNLDNQAPGTKNFKHSKSFQDKGVKRFKNRPTSHMDNGDFRNNKIRNNYKPYDDQSYVDDNMVKNNHTLTYHKNDTLPYRSFNGHLSPKLTASSHERKFLLNSTINEYSKTVNENKRNNRSKEMLEQANPLDSKQAVKERSSPKNEKNNVKMKFNFLQESQLNINISDKCKDANVSVNCKKLSNNGLNPAALEFTPSNNSNTTENSSHITDAIKSLSLDGSIITEEETEYNYDTPHLTMFHSDKVSSAYQYPPATLSRVSYPPQIISPFPLYGHNQPQLIRINNNHPGTHNMPINYLVYNPIIVNALYNHQQLNGTTATNRLIPNDTNGHIAAHQYNGYHPSFYNTDFTNHNIEYSSHNR